MSDGTINKALSSIGYGVGSEAHITGHSFKSMASTNLEQLGYDVRVIELQLAHADRNQIRAAYKRDTSRLQLDQRKVMMQQWADYLDGLKAGAQIIQFNNK